MSVLKTEKRIKKLIKFLKNEFKHGIQIRRILRQKINFRKGRLK